MIQKISTLAVGWLLALVCSGAAMAQANPTAAFTSTELSRLSSSSAASFYSASSEMAAAPGSASAIAVEVSTVQAAATSSASFWGRLVAKITFKTAATRIGAGCTVGLIRGGIASSSEVSWFMKGARIVAGCVTGVVAGAAAEFMAATVLAAGAPVWVGLGTTVFVMGAVGYGVDIAFTKLWFERAKARRQLRQVGNYLQAPPVTHRIHDHEYVSAGTKINPNRYMRGHKVQGTSVVADTAVVGYQSTGGATGQVYHYVAPPATH